MKKRNLFTLMLVALLAFTLGMGTLAYYTKTFASNDNLVRAAKFTVDSGGTLDESMEFDLTGDPLMPGETRELYEFEIHKNDTEVPVEYGVKVEGRDKLFNENSPVKLNLYKKTGEDWNLYNGAKFKATEDVEKFKIEVVWNHSEIDTNYQNATGKVAINVVATQVGEEAVVPEPEPDPLAPTVEVNYSYKPYPGFDSGTRVKINVKNIEDAARVRFQYTKNGETNYTSNTFNLEDVLFFSSQDDMPQSITVLVYDKNGSLGNNSLLHKFENVTPRRVDPKELN